MRKLCVHLCDRLLKNAVTFNALSIARFLSQDSSDAFFSLLTELYIFGSVQDVNDCRIVRDSVGHIMTAVRLAESNWIMN